MDLGLSDEQELLRSSARSVLAHGIEAAAAASDRAGTAELWRELAHLGWIGWALPRELGGGGGPFLDLVLLEVEVGRSAAPIPVHAVAGRAAVAIAEVGGPELGADVLRPLLDGTEQWAAALPDPGDEGATQITAERTSGGWCLSGSARRVVAAQDADRFLCVADTSGPEPSTPVLGQTLFLVGRATPGVTVARIATMGGDGTADVVLRGVIVGDDGVIGAAGCASDGLARAEAKVTICLAAEMLGGAEACLEMAIAHALERRQRSGPLGRHQSIQHRLADAAIAIDVGRLLLYHAAWLVDAGMPYAAAASMAKASLGDTYRDATWLSAMILGGAGFMAEHPIGRHYRRAKVAELSLGDADIHLERVAAALLDGPANSQSSRST